MSQTYALCTANFATHYRDALIETEMQFTETADDKSTRFEVRYEKEEELFYLGINIGARMKEELIKKRTA